MEAYYNNQAPNLTSRFFYTHYTQRGSGFGALAAWIGRFALPLATRIIWPAAKKIGRELLVHGATESVEFATNKKSAKPALKSTVARTGRKQIGGALQRGRKAIYRRRSRQKAYKKQTPPRKKINSRKTEPQRSRSDFFSNVKIAY